MRTRMQIRLPSIAMFLPALALSACVTAIPVHQAMPLEARTQIASTDVVVPVRQSEIYIAVPASQMAMYGGGGLLFALIDAGVDSSNAGTAEEAIKPLRNSLVDFNFDDFMQTELKTAFAQSPWLHAGNYKVVKEVSDANLDSILEASTSAAVLFVTTDYNLHWSSDALSMTVHPHLFPKAEALNAMIEKPEKSGPKTSSVNALYRNVMTFRDRAPNATDVRETNLDVWSADNAAAMRASLKRGAAKLAELLTTDLHDPLAAIDEKTTTLPKTTVDGATGYIVKSDDQGSLIQFATGTQMYITRAALADLPKGAPKADKTKAPTS